MDINKVSEEYCKWLSDIDGESYVYENLEENLNCVYLHDLQFKEKHQYAADLAEIILNILFLAKKADIDIEKEIMDTLIINKQEMFSINHILRELT